MSLVKTQKNINNSHSVEEEETMMEFLDIHKRSVSRHSKEPRNSVGVGLQTSKNKKRSDERNEMEIFQRGKKITKTLGVKSSSKLAKDVSLTDETKTSLLVLETNNRMGTTNKERKLTTKSKSNVSIRAPKRHSLGEESDRFVRKNRSDLGTRKVMSSELFAPQESNESHKKEVQEFVESVKIYSNTFLLSKSHRKQIPKASKQAATVSNTDVLKGIKEPSNTSLGSIYRNKTRSSMLSKKYSLEDDLKYLLPHLEDVTFVDNRSIRKSIGELNEIVETGKQISQETTASIQGVPYVDDISRNDIAATFGPTSIPSLNQDADKGVAFKEETELHFYHGDQSESIQPSFVEEIPITEASKSSKEIYLEDSREENEGSVIEELDEHGLSGSFSGDYEYKPGFEYKYKGDHDENNLRSNFGCLKWLSRGERRYCGYFQYNSLHGDGYYFIKRDDCLNFYDGKFFNNNLHGYGQIIYNNGDKFEGLFRDNARFGPGILTHQDGTQDVGIWYGNSIIRLSVYASECIPLLGRSTLGKLKMIDYKKIIPLNSTHEDKAYSIVESLSADEDTKKRYKELYNPHVRHSNSLFFDHSRYDYAYYGRKDFDIDVIDATTHLSDFIRKKKDIYPEQLIEINEKEMGHIERMQYELKCLEKKMRSLEYDTDNLKVSGNEILDNVVQDVVEKNVLSQERIFFRKVLEFLQFKLSKTKNADVLDNDTRKISVESILSWNNSDTMVEVFKHSFLCRKSEDNVNFNVRNLYSGNRKQFGMAGKYQKGCIEFLQACMSSDIRGAVQLLGNQNINPNVSDSKGNTALHLATWRYDTKIIGMLANHGANLDSVNDEGISPLNLCLLRYLELVYTVTNWESSFLPLDRPTIDQEYLMQWRPRDSFWNLMHTQYNVSDHSLLSRKTPTPRQSLRKKTSLKRGSKSSRISLDRKMDCCIFALKFVPVPKRFEIETGGTKSVSVKDDSEETKKKLLNRISCEEGILKCLLHYGADPNKEGVPYSPFFLALFSKSPGIVELFLSAKADPNMNLYGMTPLQVIVGQNPSDENCEIMQILLDKCSNPNILSDPSIWQECDKFLLGDFEPECEIQPRGKDALHFICLREDFTDANNHFFFQMAEKLINSKLSTRSLYLGHSHVSMAIVKGNVALVEFLSQYMDLDRPLGFGLGNALTVLALSRYPHILPFPICKRIIDFLLFEKISPFEPIYGYWNIFEFLDSDSPPDLVNHPIVWNQYEHHIKSIRALIRSHPGEETDKKSNELSKVYIQERSRSKLDVINRFKAVFYLYCFIREGCLDKNTSYLAKLVSNSEESLTYIRFIFNSGKMPRSYLSLEYVSELMEYVDYVNDLGKNIEVKTEETSSQNKPTRLESANKIEGLPKKSTADDVSLSSNKSQGKFVSRDSNRHNYMKQLSEINFKECDDINSENIHRWVTDEYLIKCNVCYFCMHRTNKTLLRCPDCGIVKFCSKRCNYLSMKLSNFHKCSSLFYQDIYQEYKTFIDNKLPIPIYGIDLAFVNSRERKKAPPAMRRHSRINFVKSEVETIKLLDSKSVKIRLQAGAELTPIELIQKLNNISESNVYERNRNNKKEKRSSGCNGSIELDIFKKPSSYGNHSGSPRKIKQLFERIDRKCNNDNDIDFNSAYCPSENKTETFIAKTGEKCSDDAKMSSLLPYIQSRHFILNLKQETNNQNRFNSKKIYLPKIPSKQDKRSSHSAKQKIEFRELEEIQNDEEVSQIDQNFSLENSLNVQLEMLRKRKFSDKKIAFQLYQYFLRELQDLDIESIFMPFTCFSGENIFHGMPGNCRYYYQSFDDNTVECFSSMV